VPDLLTPTSTASTILRERLILSNDPTRGSIAKLFGGCANTRPTAVTLKLEIFAEGHGVHGQSEQYSPLSMIPIPVHIYPRHGVWSH
jgi:hypothetical protein